MILSLKLENSALANPTEQDKVRNSGMWLIQVIRFKITHIPEFFPLSNVSQFLWYWAIAKADHLHLRFSSIFTHVEIEKHRNEALEIYFVLKAVTHIASYPEHQIYRRVSHPSFGLL